MALMTIAAARECAHASDRRQWRTVAMPARVGPVIVAMIWKFGSSMNNRGQAPFPLPGERSSGPQGTRFFSTEALRQYAMDVADGADARISVHEPVLEGSSPGIVGRRFALRPGRQAIGRRADNTIVVDDPSVSGCHAWITNQHGHCVIMNTLSTNGTFVNDRRIHETVLQHGDHIRLGQAEFVFLTRERDLPASISWRWIAIAAGLSIAALVVAAWWFLGSP
jgi:hypothetical protein